MQLCMRQHEILFIFGNRERDAVVTASVVLQTQPKIQRAEMSESE